MDMREIFENISPVLIEPKKTSLTISLSSRFFFFQLMRKLSEALQEDPYLNFIALLKQYKVLGRFLDGTLAEFYRDRNSLYFKRFFYDERLYEIVKKDLEEFYPKYSGLKMTITKRGLIIYDNYKKNSFNVLVLTVHSGTWVPKNIEKKLALTEEERRNEEDIATNLIYSKIVLDQAGIWIDNKQSRFVVDLNRKHEHAIYQNHLQKRFREIWKELLSAEEIEENYVSYREFYFTLSKLVDAYNFNVIFDGHSMRDRPGRPNISFGTQHIPSFYMPIVRNMKKKMMTLGYSPVAMNKPYSGGHILKWLNALFPNVFICSMEINKKLYLSGTRVNKKQCEKLSQDLKEIFKI
ncbi:MAG: N-formylglutamate amidohydrolase [Candidatus Woesearchaeota archaeon]